MPARFHSPPSPAQLRRGVGAIRRGQRVPGAPHRQRPHRRLLHLCRVPGPPRVQRTSPRQACGGRRRSVLPRGRRGARLRHRVARAHASDARVVLPLVRARVRRRGVPHAGGRATRGEWWGASEGTARPVEATGRIAHQWVQTARVVSSRPQWSPCPRKKAPPCSAAPSPGAPWTCILGQHRRSALRRGRPALLLAPPRALGLPRAGASDDGRGGSGMAASSCTGARDTCPAPHALP